MSQDELRTYILQWDNRFPFDRWWREKHNVAFLSTQHRETNFLYQKLEYVEEQMFTEIEQSKSYKPNTGDFFKEGSKIAESDGMEDFIQKAREELKNLPKNL